MTKPDDAAQSDQHEAEENTAPESISTEDSDIGPAEREHLEIDANAFRASLKY